MPALFPFAVWARLCRGGLSALLSPVILIALLLALFTVGTAHAQSKSGAALPAAELPSPNGITPPGDDPAPAPQDYAYAVGMSAPASMVAGSTVNVTVTMRNGGTTTWSGTVSNPYWLGLANPLNSSIWGVSRVRVANTVAPNGQSTFGFTITAPTTPGNYSFDWRMLRQTGTWFGETATHTITVTPIPVYDAQLTGATVPATMTAGGMYNVSLTFKNTGNVTWTQNENYRIGSNNPVDNVTFGNNRLNMNVASVAPGQSASFSFPVQAPATPNTYLFDWGMLWEWHFRFGQTSAVAVTVVAAPLKPTITVTRNLSPVAEQAFTTTWKTTDASSVTRVCTASGSGYTVNEPLAVNGTRTETAQAAWVGYPSNCTWTASGAGGTVSHVETMTTLPAGSGVTYIHTDGLGSPVARSNAVGQVLSRTRYEAYGQAAEGTAKTIGFTGHVNDADTGLTYMQQRYYDPVAGRFLSVDPVTTDANTGGSFNRYAYATNSPYKYVDPDGRNPKLVIDFALNVALNVVTTGELGLAVAAKETVVGALNPVKTLNTAAKLGGAIYRGSKLARNMANAGRGVAKGKEEAHHIVAQTDKRASGSQDILQRNGIGVHDADNGAAMVKAEHRGVHTNEYHQNVEQRLTTAESRGSCAASCENEVRRELKEIARELEK